MSQYCGSTLSISEDMIHKYISRMLSLTNLNLMEDEVDEITQQILDKIKAFAKSKGISENLVFGMKKHREEFIRQHASSLGMSGDELTEAMATIKNNRPPSLMKMLQEYANEKNVPLSCFYNPNGLSKEDLDIAASADPGYMLSHEEEFHSYHIYEGIPMNNLMDTAQDAMLGMHSAGREAKPMLAIPPAVATQLYGGEQAIREYVFVGIVDHDYEADEENEDAANPEEVSLALDKGPRKDMHVGIHDLHYNHNEIGFNKQLTDLAGDLLTGAWQDKLEQKLEEIKGSADRIALMLMHNYEEADAAHVDQINVSNISPGSINIIPYSNEECDLAFTVEVTLDCVADDQATPALAPMPQQQVDVDLPGSQTQNV